MNWYTAEDGNESVRQVVIEVSEPHSVESKFASLMLAAKYHQLRASTWTAGLFRLDGAPGPYLLVRADGHVERLRNQPFRVGFCFYRLRTGALIVLCVDFLKLRLTGVPSAPFVLFEMRSGVDIEEDRLRVQDALNRPQLHICFAQGEGTGKELPSGAWSGGPINASYDVLVDMDAECRRALNREWNSLLEHHASAPGGRPDTSKPARPNADAPTFVCEEHPAPQVTKRMFKAGNARSAVEFLTAQPRITRPYYYVEVRTPDGLFGIDNGGFIYDANGNPVSPDRYRPSQAHAESPQRSPILDRKPSEPTVKGAGSPVTSSLPRKRWWQVWRHFS